MAKHFPTIAERAREQLCPECGEAVPQEAGRRGRRRVFCSPEHKRAHNNRALSEGAAVIHLLKGWRVDRGQGDIAKESFRQFCQIVDDMISKDREAGRPRPDLYAAKLMADGRLYMDRSR